METDLTIRFSPIFYDSVIKGHKSGTVRLHHYDGSNGRPLYQPGPFNLVFSDQNSLEGVITEVRFVRFEYHPHHISDEVLLAEGFETGGEENFHKLYKGMVRWYPNFKYGDDITVIFFKLDSLPSESHNH